MLASCYSIAVLLLGAQGYPVFDAELPPYGYGDYPVEVDRFEPEIEEVKDYSFDPEDLVVEEMPFYPENVEDDIEFEQEPVEYQEIPNEYELPEDDEMVEVPEPEEPTEEKQIKVMPNIVAGHTEPEVTPKPVDKLEKKRGQKEKAQFLQNHEDKSKQGGH